jgi:hypothetical protein
MRIHSYVTSINLNFDFLAHFEGNNEDWKTFFMQIKQQNKGHNFAWYNFWSCNQFWPNFLNILFDNNLKI